MRLQKLQITLARLSGKTTADCTDCADEFKFGIREIHVIHGLL
jgi:hypothetical protein